MFFNKIQLSALGLHPNNESNYKDFILCTESEVIFDMKESAVLALLFSAFGQLFCCFESQL
jgi:hypothetical protein